MSGGHQHEATLQPFQILSKKYDIIKALLKICALGILKECFFRKDLAWLDKSWRHSEYYYLLHLTVSRTGITFLDIRLPPAALGIQDLSNDLW